MVIRAYYTSYGHYVDILAAVKRTAIPHHATFLGWSLNGVDASRDAASLTEVLRFPPRPF
ncbi:MAG: hypothetical protein IM504_14945 [Microcystis sp. M038S2]|nr:hypothetical protein [Microcystis sp. M038S2]MCA2948891.1 hypothetical protein [Microcystis sp. M109S1]